MLSCTPYDERFLDERFLQKEVFVEVEIIPGRGEKGKVCVGLFMAWLWAACHYSGKICTRKRRELNPYPPSRP